MNLNKPGSFYTFQASDFLKNYTDKENNPAMSLYILSLPTYGVLKFGETIITSTKTIINLNEISRLKYYRINPNSYTDTFNFKISDLNQNTKFTTNMATFTINVNAYENEPPVIGDNEITINFGTTKTFSIADFTTNTTPAYSDPEGDGPFKLKITSLPGTGELRYDNIPVTINQEILFSNIGLGLLTYIPDIVDLGGYSDDTFDFEISDLGSQEFSS